ncbi:ABC transporter ATP-binding protein, partial [Neisseria dumasiana]
SYNDGALRVQVLQGLNFQVREGQSVSIIGASGSGKSTLLHILGGLDMPSLGKIELMGNDLGALNQKQLGLLRNQYLGFVYQFHHLLPEFSALENVMMPLLIAKKPKAQAEEQAVQMLDRVGLKARMQHRPSELSGGERQRAAIARALVTRPK